MFNARAKVSVKMTACNGILRFSDQVNCFGYTRFASILLCLFIQRELLSWGKCLLAQVLRNYRRSWLLRKLLYEFILVELLRRGPVGRLVELWWSWFPDQILCNIVRMIWFTRLPVRWRGRLVTLLNHARRLGSSDIVSSFAWLSLTSTVSWECDIVKNGWSLSWRHTLWTSLFAIVVTVFISILVLMLIMSTSFTPGYFVPLLALVAFFVRLLCSIQLLIWALVYAHLRWVSSLDDWERASASRRFILAQTASLGSFSLIFDIGVSGATRG